MTASLRANRSDEIAVTETMIGRVERHFGLAAARLAGDTAYGAAKLLKWLDGTEFCWTKEGSAMQPTWSQQRAPAKAQGMTSLPGRG